MSESRLDFWNRQTLREKPAEILADWKASIKGLESKIAKSSAIAMTIAIEYNDKLAENKKLKEALSFYADPDVWRNACCSDESFYLEDDFDTNEWGGKLARQVLKELE